MALKPLSENARTILTYLQENVGKDLTYTDIAEATGLAPKTVNGVITSGLGRKDRLLVTRVKVEGNDKKLIVLTDLGATYDPTADDEAE